MRPMPLPVRIAAGLVVTALEQARRFPEQIAELPVTAASRAVQAGMRVQQRVTELAIKGDEVFALFRQVEDTPSWARFDEDDEPAQGPDAEPATTPDSTVRRISTHRDLPTVVPGQRRHGEVDEADVARELSPDRPPAGVAEPDRTPGPDRTPDAGQVPHAEHNGSGPEPTGRSTEAAGPPALPGYDDMSLAQLRGKLRALSLADLESLLEHEHAHQDRAPFVTMLSNRIITVRSQ